MEYLYRDYCSIASNSVTCDTYVFCKEALSITSLLDAIDRKQGIVLNLDSDVDSNGFNYLKLLNISLPNGFLFEIVKTDDLNGNKKAKVVLEKENLKFFALIRCYLIQEEEYSFDSICISSLDSFSLNERYPENEIKIFGADQSYSKEELIHQSKELRCLVL